ncbi:MAG: DNA-directed RNA polymerase subunit beta' [Candidatus Pacebacteria bacterium]|nr:DNA-directed RNA polymerase subunit beta' [Candidatus Paceibacterota bacterium]
MSFQKKEHFIPHTISLHVASPETINKWSRGEITKPETINYRTGRSERGGLFDEKIFGPEKDYECYCKKYRGIKYKGITCEKCGVEITRSIVRRERMGHIELASPVSHIWMLRGIPSRMSLLMGISISDLEKVVYFAGYIVTMVDQEEKKRVLKDLENEYRIKMKTLEKPEDKERLQDLFSSTKKDIIDIVPGRVLSEIEYNNFSLRYATVFEAGIGAEAIYDIFKNLDLVALEKELVENLEKARATTRERVEKRLQLVRSLIQSETKPEWMFLTHIPVIPPALRPMVALEGGRHATSDINDLYRRVINRNNRLKKLKEIGAPDVILRNEKRIMQEAVDSLIDNSIRKHSGGAAMSQSQRRQLKSLSDNLKGKQGLFRQNLLGKRVDYSGRSVIIVGPRLKLDQCGLPKHMALELFRPFVISKIIERDLAYNIRGAGKLVEEPNADVWEILDEVIKGKYVLLNRAPTLHRLSIQAFKPVLIEGKAIQVHPLVCSAFNADFDGDQMAVHLPLSEESQAETAQLISSAKNLLKPQDGNPITAPAQDIVLGCFWMTKEVEGARGEGKMFSRPNEAITAYDFGEVDFRAKIKVVGTDSVRYNQFEGKPFDTTVGRLLFNSVLPSDYAYVNKPMKKGDLSLLMVSLIEDYGMDAVPPILDKIKDFGFKYVTKSGTTFGLDDAHVPEDKPAVVASGQKKADDVQKQFEDGLISELERYRKTIEIWEEVKLEIEKMIGDNITVSESVHDMVTSKARGSVAQLTQMSGMKGLIVNTKGQSIDFPIIPSYKEGLSPVEYFITTHGARKGLTDSALNTAKAGYLTRRLVDVAQDIVVRDADCGTSKGIVATSQNVDGIQRPLYFFIFGRTSLETIKDAAGNVLCKKGDIISKKDARAIEAAGITEVKVRSLLTCETLHGVCQTCYGEDLGRAHPVKMGEAVGIVAAQAIGEPGTQLTLRSFHSGGVTGLDITTGLPRIEEIFERRKPKAQAFVAEASGEVTELRKEGEATIVVILGDGATAGKKDSQVQEYKVPSHYTVVVDKGARVEKGDLITDGSADINEIFEFGGLEKAQNYIISEINKVYELHGSPISPKHIEIIVRQMFSRRKIKNPGDTMFTTGETVEYIQFMEENNRTQEKGGQIAKSEVLVMGITEVSLSTKSWLSSASFQHTTRTLVANAVRGESDELRGLKENVILGNLIPAGTGINDDFIVMPEAREPRESRDSYERA